MMKQIDIFGNEIDIEVLSRDNHKIKHSRLTIKGKFRSFHGYNKKHTCKDCIFHIASRYHNKIYHKCKKIGISNSEATDIRLKDYSCDLFVEASGEFLKKEY